MPGDKNDKRLRQFGEDAAPLDDAALLNLYSQADTALPASTGGPLTGDALIALYAKPEEKKDPAPLAITVRPSGPLSNSPDDGFVTAGAKNIATGAVKGVGTALDPAGNAKGLADYLLMRAEAKITGRPVEDVAAEHAAKASDPRLTESILGRLGAAVAPTNVLPSSEALNNKLLSATGEYVPEGTMGRMVQGGVQGVIGALGPGSVGGRVPVPVAPVARTLPMVAASSATGTGVAEATGDPLLGMAAGAAPALAASGARGTANLLTGTVSPQRATLAEIAANRFGIDLGAGQISESPFVNRLNTLTAKLPFSGRGEASARQGVQFNRAVAETFGENADHVTPDVMARARDRIGQVYEDLPLRVPVVATDAPFHLRLQQIRHEAATLGDTIAQPVERQIDNVLSAVNNGNLTGQAYRALIKRGSALDRAANGSNRDVAAYARDIRTELNRVFGQSAPPDVRAELAEANQQWRNMRTIEDIVAKSPDGNLSPGLLQGRVNAANKGTHGAAYGGGGDLKQLADVSRMIMPAGSSNSAENLGWMGAAGAMGSAITGLATGGMSPSTAAMTAASPLVAAAISRGAGSYLQSPIVANALIARSLGRAPAPGLSNRLLAMSIPALEQMTPPRIPERR